MKMFSDCSGPCCLCVCHGGGCVAGHGDDEFYPADIHQLRKFLLTEKDEDSRKQIEDCINQLVKEGSENEKIDC